MTEVVKPPEWMLSGLCAEIDGDIWFPDYGCGSRLAKSICARCDVQNECLTYALAERTTGIWGGTTERDRQKLRREAA